MNVVSTLNGNLADKVAKFDYSAPSGTSDEDAMKNCFDSLPAGIAVCGKINASSQFFYVASTYGGSHNYGSMIAVLFNGNVKVMGVSGGTKTIRTL